ncbi:hypothetical protein TAESTU_10825 [Tenacibaculum aestuarii]
MFALGNLEAAIPNPNEGCIIKNGATIVVMPITNAGNIVGA